MTAAELLTDPDFIAFCGCWEADGRCPLGLADWLRDKGLEGQAGAAEWAATEPDRRDVGGMGGARPYRHSGGYAWGKVVTVAPWGPWRSDIPPDVYARLRRVVRPTFPVAIASLLDAWALARRG